ncbi:YciE/YciF ferroxidase family protein [Larkinella arboricola]|uniref:Ferritin-like metal-binding protein YciE n=1 Tax=Larkinella arboricola TaxID=643671 RepID=A0A327XAJ6_LARAB|nr:ferritin-like domain-containing protein [Larkinella arboricola]RAK03134.1 ferritin-like metal-binding protein YciE [Larkinella arboricola]
MASFTDQLANFFGMNDTDTSLRELFISELKGIYYGEKQIADALPTMAEAATTDVVRDAFHQHLAETRNQIQRLEQIFQHIGVEADEKTCNAVDGLVDDGDVVIAATDSGSLTRDAGLIIAGQKVEHHEIAAYGSLHSLARLLGYHEAAQLIEQSLEEEKMTDKKLTEIAESFINERAKLESDNDDDTDRNGIRSQMRDTVREGDYGQTTGPFETGSSRSGVTGTGTEETAGTANRNWNSGDDVWTSPSSNNPYRGTTDPTAGGPSGL